MAPSSSRSVGPTPRSKTPFLSVVVPCYNEEEALPLLYKRLKQVVPRLTSRYEFVFSNDGSRDRTLEVIERLVEQDHHVRGINLSRNFGHQACLTAGLDVARGDVVVMMDADLQDPPELIPKMLQRWQDGADVVYAVRRQRRGESPFKKATAALFYRLLSLSTRLDIPLDTGDFRLIDRRALDAVLDLRESHRFLRGMFTWVGFRQEPVMYTRERRVAGETKYPLRKMLQFALDAFTSFTIVPLRIATWLGLAAALISFVYAINVIVEAYQGGTVPGWASTTVSVLFLGGVQLLTIGLLGEYLGRVFEQVKNRPIYFVREILERPAPAEDSPQE